MDVCRDKPQKQLEVRLDEMQDDLEIQLIYSRCLNRHIVVVVGNVSCLGKLGPGTSSLWQSLLLHSPVVLAQKLAALLLLTFLVEL